MIELADVVRYHDTPSGPKILFASISAVFPDMARVGILADIGSGKSTLARLLSGIEKPDSGSIRSTGRISWPLGASGGLHPDLTGAENIAIYAGLLNDSVARAQAFCVSFGALEDVLDRKVKVYSPAIRARLGYSLSMAFQCDTYIADDVIAVGDTEFRDRCTAMLERRLAGAGLVLISKNASQLDRYCNQFMGLIAGQLVECNSAQQAADILDLARHHVQPDNQEHETL